MWSQKGNVSYIVASHKHDSGIFSPWLNDKPYNYWFFMLSQNIFTTPSYKRQTH